MAGVTPAARVERVNGPLVEVTGLLEPTMLGIVELGEAALPSEIVSIAGDRVVLQAYEYTGGLRVGDPAVFRGLPLSGRLGPGLLGHAFDGLMRPLSEAPRWLVPGQSDAAATRTWRFRPVAGLGEELAAGDVLGIVPDSGAVEHRVLVPAGLAGTLEWIAPDGDRGWDDAVARVAGRDILLAERWPLRRPRPFAERLGDVVPLHTGQRVLDLLYPVARGATAAVPGGFGTGKTLLLQQIAKWSDADVIVYVGCGERGNEMADVLDSFSALVDSRTGGRLIDRTVIIANTSNMPMMARVASIATGVTIAEYYRDMGHDAVVIADSTSRWAEALREFANRNGELPAEEGYPASLASELARFYERAGRVTTLGGQLASVTVIGAVSPQGGDMTEPVTTNTQRFVRSLWLLDRELAYSRHYPAVSWTGSFSRDADAIADWHAANGDPAWGTQRARAGVLLAEADRLAGLAEIVGTSGLPPRERMILLGGRLLREGVLMQNALNDNDGFCSAEKGAALLAFALDTIDECQRLVSDGAAATTVEQFDFSPLLRAREDVGPDDAAAVRERAERFLAELAGVA